MTTEASITQKLTAHIKKCLASALVFKLSDRITKGVPDIAVALNGATVWLEIKMLRKGETPVARVAKDPLQLLRMRQLHEQTGGRAWYVMYDLTRGSKQAQTVIYSPHALMLSQESTNGFGLPADFPTAVVPGLDHGAVVRLLENVA